MERKPTHRIYLRNWAGIIDSHDVYGGTKALATELSKLVREQWTDLFPGDVITFEEL
jgi:hypothetical protein